MTNKKKTLKEMIERFIEGDHSVGVYESIEQYMTEAYQFSRTQAINDCINSLPKENERLDDLYASGNATAGWNTYYREAIEALNNLLTK
jgi:hypothetical protein